MKIQLTHSFEDIISVENLLEAWKEFVNGKKQKKDVQIFQLRLMDNIFSLHQELSNHTWKHGGYQAFKINDPKPRNIHKATVRDRLLHHAIYRKLYPFFAKTFIADSYSCQINKGTHRAINRFRTFANKISKNNTQTCWILKCDIKKFFANIDHKILLDILTEYIPDKNILWLLENVIYSFEAKLDVGLPLGNLTSQLFVNIYLNEFDQFVKHKLKAKYYLRYCDDFVIFSEDKKCLENIIPIIGKLLAEKLKLKLHPDKVSIETLASGVDFLGINNFSHHKILRTKTKKRIMKKLSLGYANLQHFSSYGNCHNLRNDMISEESLRQSLQSYLGILKHCEGYKVEKTLQKIYS
jgi:RNA-directed DNA polymerase